MSTGDSGFGLLLEPLMAKNAATSASANRLPRFVFISLLTPSRLNQILSKSETGIFPELIFNIVRRIDCGPKNAEKNNYKVNKCLLIVHF